MIYKHFPIPKDVHYLTDTINRREARDVLGLNIVKPDEHLYKLIKNLYDDISKELGFGDVFDPRALLKTNGGEYTIPNTKGCTLSDSFIRILESAISSFIASSSLANSRYPLTASTLTGIVAIGLFGIAGFSGVLMLGSIGPSVACFVIIIESKRLMILYVKYTVQQIKKRCNDYVQKSSRTV